MTWRIGYNGRWHIQKRDALRRGLSYVTGACGEEFCAKPGEYTAAGIDRVCPECLEIERGLEMAKKKDAQIEEAKVETQAEESPEVKTEEAGGFLELGELVTEEVEETPAEEDTSGTLQPGTVQPPEVREVTQYAYREAAKAAVVKAGLRFIKKPEVPDELLSPYGNVELPQDVTKLTDENLGEFLSTFSALAAYAECVVALADVDWTVAERVAQFAERIEILKLPKDQQKNEDLRIGSVHLKKYVRELRQTEMQALMVFKLAGGVLRGYEKAVASLSREITRRGNSNAFERYETNIDKRGRR